MDITKVITDVVSLITTSPVVIVLVALVKMMFKDLQGNAVKLVAACIGGIIGVVWVLGQPVQDSTVWITGIVAGLLSGFTSSYLYDLLKKNG